MSVVVSAKVPKESRERARRYGISISKVVRRTLEAEVAKAEEEKLRTALDEVSHKLKRRVAKEDLVRAVRESREGR